MRNTLLFLLLFLASCGQDKAIVDLTDAVKSLRCNQIIMASSADEIRFAVAKKLGISTYEVNSYHVTVYLEDWLPKCKDDLELEDI